MKKILFQNFPFGLFILCFFTNQLIAQELPLTQSYKTDAVNRAANLLTEYYVFPEIAVETANYIISLDKKGHFDEIIELDEFAAALTNSIYEVAKDKHLMVSRTNQADMNAKVEDDILTRLERRHYYRSSNAGFKSVQKLENNIGYLNLRGFYGLELGKTNADIALDMLSTADAIIIDLRENRGGRGDMVDYLLSYFFEDSIITSKTLKRIGDRFVENTHWTTKQKANKVLAETPLFVLLSDQTISAAEGFAFAIQKNHRATLVGEVTAGAANPGDLIPLNDDLQIFVSDVSVTYPTDNSTWEGIGVIPDIKVKQEIALETAIEQANVAAQNYRDIATTKAKESILKLEAVIQNYTAKSSSEEIINAYLNCKENDVFFTEYELNILGYRYLGDESKTMLGKAILEANTILYPNSANVYDSFGDALFSTGQFKEAYWNYEKAVNLGSYLNHQDLATFRSNLTRAKGKLLEQGETFQEKEEISKTLMDYIDGTANGELDRLREAFHPDFNLYTVTKENKLRIRNGAEYISNFQQGVKTGRVGKIISIDFENNAAIAKAEIMMPNKQVYTDYFLLLKYEGSWKIAHKSYTLIE